MSVTIRRIAMLCRSDSERRYKMSGYAINFFCAGRTQSLFSRLLGGKMPLNENEEHKILRAGLSKYLGKNPREMRGKIALLGEEIRAARTDILGSADKKLGAFSGDIARISPETIREKLGGQMPRNPDDIQVIFSLKDLLGNGLQRAMNILDNLEREL